MMELYSLNFPNGKKYIGMSVNAAMRFDQHINAARRNKIKRPVYSAIRKHGCVLQVLCVGSDKYIEDLEVKAIAVYGTQNIRHGYNITAGGEGVGGWHPSAATRAKHVANALKQMADPVARERLRGNTHALGKRYKHKTVRTPEYCAKKAASTKAQWNKRGARKKLGAAMRAGWTEEVRKQWGLLQKAKWADPVYRAMMLKARLK